MIHVLYGFTILLTFFTASSIYKGIYQRKANEIALYNYSQGRKDERADLQERTYGKHNEYLLSANGLNEPCDNDREAND